MAQWEALKLKGNALYQEEKFSDAIREYTRAIQHDSGQSVLFVNRALAHLKLGAFEQASQDAAKAVELCPNGNSVTKAHYILGRCYSKDGLHSAAIRHFKHCLDKAGESDTTRGLYSEVFHYYFTSRKAFYDMKRAEHLASLRAEVERHKALLDVTLNETSSLIEQLFMVISEGKQWGREEFGASVPSSVRNAEFLEEMPECFVCPISLEVMRDPVMVIGTANPAVMCSKHSYEREQIVRHFQINGNVDPIGRFAYSPVPVLLPNLTLRNSIHCFLESHPWLYTNLGA